MDVSTVNFFMICNQQYFPAATLPSIRQQLLTLDNAKLEDILAIQFYNPSTYLSISMVLGIFGIDRFFLGQKMLGTIKFFTIGGLAVWALVDSIRMVGITRRLNYKKLIRELCK